MALGVVSLYDGPFAVACLPKELVRLVLVMCGCSQFACTSHFCLEAFVMSEATVPKLSRLNRAPIPIRE